MYLKIVHSYLKTQYILKLKTLVQLLRFQILEKKNINNSSLKIKTYQKSGNSIKIKLLQKTKVEI